MSITLVKSKPSFFAAFLAGIYISLEVFEKAGIKSVEGDHGLTAILTIVFSSLFVALISLYLFWPIFESIFNWFLKQLTLKEPSSVTAEFYNYGNYYITGMALSKLVLIKSLEITSTQYDMKVIITVIASLIYYFCLVDLVYKGYNTTVLQAVIVSVLSLFVAAIINCLAFIGIFLFIIFIASNLPQIISFFKEQIK